MDSLCSFVVGEVITPEWSGQTEIHEKQQCRVTQNPEGFRAMETYGYTDISA